MRQGFPQDSLNIARHYCSANAEDSGGHLRIKPGPDRLAPDPASGDWIS